METGGYIIVLCMTLISGIAASSNKEAKKVEERVAEEVTISYLKRN